MDERGLSLKETGIFRNGVQSMVEKWHGFIVHVEDFAPHSTTNSHCHNSSSSSYCE
jgi:hypothetical protein